MSEPQRAVQSLPCAATTATASPKATATVATAASATAIKRHLTGPTWFSKQSKMSAVLRQLKPGMETAAAAVAGIDSGAAVHTVGQLLCTLASANAVNKTAMVATSDKWHAMLANAARATADTSTAALATPRRDRLLLHLNCDSNLKKVLQLLTVLYFVHEGTVRRALAKVRASNITSLPHI